MKQNKNKSKNRNRKWMERMVLSILVALLTIPFVSITGITAGEVPEVKIRSASLSLEDNVYIWCDMSLENVDRNTDAYGMIFWESEQAAGAYTYKNAQNSLGTQIRDKAAGTWSHDDKLNCDVVTYTYKISAKEMADIVYAQGYAKVNGTYYYSEVVPYSAVTYASRQMELISDEPGAEEEAFQALLRSMLEYGAAAQIYFGYHTDHLANEILHGLEFTSNHDGTCAVTGIGNCTNSELIIPEKSPIGDTVTSIGSNAFLECSNLTCITIPSSVTLIGANAFLECGNLTRITIPSSITVIGAGAFDNCVSLEKIVFQGTREQWKSIHGENTENEYFTVICTDGEIS